MQTRRNLIIATFVLVLLPALPAILGGCDSKPGEPVFDNVFDPEGPELGDPLNVVAAFSDTSITVIWNQPQGFGIVTYDIFHSYSYGSGYGYFATVEHTDLATGILYYPNPEPTMGHYFRVNALAENGDFITISYQKPGSVITPPRVVMGDGSGSSPTRYITLTVTVSSGEEIVVADNEEFVGSLPFPVIEPGTPQDIPWDLGLAEANDEEKKIFIKALTGSTESVVFADSVTVNFQPIFTVADAGATVPSRLVDLEIPGPGILQMRFALSTEALSDSPWLGGAEILTGFELADTLDEQVIYAEFDGDFGFVSSVVELPVAGDSLADAAFSVDLGEATVTDDPVVLLECSAVAMLMRFAESPDFTAVPWLDYEDTLAFELSPGAGRKTIYGQFRNDFIDSPILTASVDYVEQSVAVGFLAPADEADLTGGVPLQVRGWADSASGASVDLVKVDLGDGAGFIAPEGREDWFLLWDVPRVEVATHYELRARAWSAADSATANISVTVNP